ncbi:MAG: exodeoxyribonuclease VII small subunit, partial [Aliifodinibius sp.]|nr:exodeoxyribonuclease VII small subunit [candidate division Zixibacteria bacterium]NIT55339.1 exodeoxyribonuclease VII small subunit [Fodinibius sp.]NIW43648.1 exodeoxyribonuclease VII small subunit [Gammaproteobacteria bacterium]NIS44765.1 exodeoxyribonuclease VII small subunit [candidate division Zixibacteria bacterium]NIU12856.1 exodeoxyribonuclease VII small subunit [candidate division Zixibacteria bacterium]
LELFEEGMKLIDLCNDKLNEAEKKISKLTRSADGTLQSEPWDDSVSE